MLLWRWGPRQLAMAASRMPVVSSYGTFQVGRTSDTSRVRGWILLFHRRSRHQPMRRYELSDRINESARVDVVH
jgi:hypothetical protein